MFTLDDVLKNYNLGAQTGRRYSKDNPKEPDYFEDVNGNGVYLYDPSQQFCDRNTYYSMAFANYWKRGVQKQMQAQGMIASPEAIVIEMAKSLDALNHICGAVINSLGAGVSFEAILKNGDLSHLPYADMFLQTFSQSQVRFETLFHAISENVNSNMELSEANCKNGLITYAVKHQDSTPVKQGVWETGKSTVATQGLQR